VSASGNGKIKAVQAGTEEACSGAGCGGDAGKRFVAVGGGLFDNINETFATGDVQALACGVVKEVVGVAGNGEVGNGLAGFGVESSEARRFAATDKEAVVRFVQGHGEVGLEFFHRPRGDDETFLTVN